MSNNKKSNFYRSQAQKRLKLVYEYAKDDLELGISAEPYHLLDIAGINIETLLTDAEFNMWRDIRTWGRGLRFYPEYSIGDDFVDFADPSKRIVIEVDSGVHNSIKDKEKDIRLKKHGFRVIRIHDSFIKKDIFDIYDQINTLKEIGKFDIAENMTKNLDKNSEQIVFNLRENQNSVSDTSIIRLSEYAETAEFKNFFNKYIAKLPEQLKLDIDNIPLIKPAS